MPKFKAIIEEIIRWEIEGIEAKDEESAEDIIWNRWMDTPTIESPAHDRYGFKLIEEEGSLIEINQDDVKETDLDMEEEDYIKSYTAKPTVDDIEFYQNEEK